MELRAKLEEVEAAVLTAKPKFRFEPPASDAELDQLRATRASTAVVIGWFAWHAGSQSGFLPDSSVCIIQPSKARDEIRCIEEDLPAGVAFCPLLEDGGGGLWLYVDTTGGELWRYERGEILWTKPFSGWLAELVATWRAEPNVLRVEFLRAGRSMNGWRQVELPTRAKKRVVRWLRNAATPLIVRQHKFDVRLRIGGELSWSEDDAGVDIVLTEALASVMASKLARADYAQVGDLEAKISFSGM